jgi:hypothetical protein
MDVSIFFGSSGGGFWLTGEGLWPGCVDNSGCACKPNAPKSATTIGKNDFMILLKKTNTLDYLIRIRRSKRSSVELAPAAKAENPAIFAGCITGFVQRGMGVA